MTIDSILGSKGRDVATVSKDRSLLDAAALLREHGVGALVVSDDGSHIEGIVSERDLVRAIQDTRKAAGLNVSDRIDLSLSFGSESEWAGTRAYESMIGEETLATTLATSWHAPVELGAAAALAGEAGAYRATVPAERYSNNEAIVIELSVHGRGVDV